MASETPRVETGPHRATPGDWLGVFIRGDDAMGYALSLSMLLLDPCDPSTRRRVTRLVGLLQSCDESKEASNDDE